MFASSYHLSSSSYQLFDGYTVDVQKTHILHFNSSVAAQYSLEFQTTQSGREFESITLGRADEYTSGIRLFYPLTKHLNVQRTSKFFGEHSIRGILFDRPITLEIFTHDDVVPPSPEFSAPPGVVPDVSPPAAAPCFDQLTAPST